MERYDVYELKEGEYTFETRKGLCYCIELKNSNSSYELIDGNEKTLQLFSFSIFDNNGAIESDYITRNTILEFLKDFFKFNNNEAILFFINNELDTTHFTHRAKSRLKLFRRLFRYAKQTDNLNLVFLTNEHFIINPQEYKMDYIGIIIKASSQNYINIVRTFNKFCHINSYQNTFDKG